MVALGGTLWVYIVWRHFVPHNFLCIFTICAKKFSKPNFKNGSKNIFQIREEFWGKLSDMKELLAANEMSFQLFFLKVFKSKTKTCRLSLRGSRLPSRTCREIENRFYQRGHCRSFLKQTTWFLKNLLG